MFEFKSLTPDDIAAGLRRAVQRLTREEGIHLEYSVTPLYGSVYIEGIGNLYEFDCGQSSGWVYAVNGEFPGYSCSEHALTDGDRVLFAYTCQQGDVQALAEELS